MSVEDVMREHGFNLSASCAGKAAYTKFTEYNGKRAYISITDAKGEGFPISLDEPVLVTIYDFRSGDELEEARQVESLGDYLESMNE